MKHHLLFLIMLICIPLHAAKIIGLVPVRNEELLVEQCLRGLALYTDSIIVLDNASEDRTLEIVRSLVDECSIERILYKKIWKRAESDDRNILLEVGRELGGTHFLVIDADELFTANCAHNDMLRNKILELQPGDLLFLHWIRLWKSVHTYRAKSIELKKFAFCDTSKRV